MLDKPKWAQTVARFFFAQRGTHLTEQYVFYMSSSAFKLESERNSQPPIFIGGENASDSRTSAIIELLRPLVEPLGYEILHLEVQNSREKALRLFIDFSTAQSTSIGIEDCVKVTRALNEVLGDVELDGSELEVRTSQETPALPRSEIALKIDALFSGPYELEVSSPGIDRPLRHSADFARFAGQEARIHTFRPLTGEEASNAHYISKNPKQKNFLGTLRGVTKSAVIVDLSAQDGVKSSGLKKTSKSALKKASSTSGTTGLRTEVESNENARRIHIPFAVISKANIEPDFNFPHPHTILGDES